MNAAAAGILLNVSRQVERDSPSPRSADTQAPEVESEEQDGVAEALGEARAEAP